MNEEALAQDETGVVWITLKLNGDLWPSRHDLETLFGAQVLADHTRHEITPVEDCQHVGVADIQAGKEARQEEEFSRQTKIQVKQPDKSFNVHSEEGGEEISTNADDFTN